MIVLISVWARQHSDRLVLFAFLGLATQRQFGVFTEREEESFDCFGFAGCGKGGPVSYTHLTLPTSDLV